MISRSTILHLRFPFSIFLLPVFLFALSISNNPNIETVLLVFFIIHFLLYPASNGFNSYFDRDQESIGGLKIPPKVTDDLYYVAIILDVIAIALGFFISWQFALMLFIYGLVSKAYSHPSIRLKKHPYLSWLIAGFFQGFFTFLACYVGLNEFGINSITSVHVIFPAFLSSALLWGSYPMTQIYQHDEDSKRGDRTLSITLGIRGTFHFTALFFTLSVAGFVLYYLKYFDTYTAGIFLLFLLPVLGYFLLWYRQVRKDESRADFTNTMHLNLISSVSLAVFFLWLSSRHLFASI